MNKFATTKCNVTCTTCLEPNVFDELLNSSIRLSKSNGPKIY